MTMHFALRAKHRSIVFASDMKVRSLEKAMTGNSYTPDNVTTQSKIRFSERHQIAVALAGNFSLGEDPAQELADFISGHESIPDELSQILIPWGNEYFQRKYPGEKHEFPIAHFTIVHPTTKYCQFWRLRVAHSSSDEPSDSFLMNGQDRSSVVFWPEYLRCDKAIYEIKAATRIAAITILMASELNPHGVGGLEIWLYEGEWKRVALEEIEHLKDEFRRFHDSIRSGVLR